MNTLLIFFAIPVATVILAIVLQKILRCPLLVAATFFAIFLIITFAAFDASFLVLAILYTILAYVTAVLVKVICKAIETWRNWNNGNCRIIERPIAINNTTPCVDTNLETSTNVINDTGLISDSTTNSTNDTNLAGVASLIGAANLSNNNEIGRRTNCNCNRR